MSFICFEVSSSWFCCFFGDRSPLNQPFSFPQASCFWLQVHGSSCFSSGFNLWWLLCALYLLWVLANSLFFLPAYVLISWYLVSTVCLFFPLRWLGLFYFFSALCRSLFFTPWCFFSLLSHYVILLPPPVSAMHLGNATGYGFRSWGRGKAHICSHHHHPVCLCCSGFSLWGPLWSFSIAQHRLPLEYMALGSFG